MFHVSAFRVSVFLCFVFLCFVSKKLDVINTPNG